MSEQNKIPNLGELESSCKVDISPNFRNIISTLGEWDLEAIYCLVQGEHSKIPNICENAKIIIELRNERVSNYFDAINDNKTNYC